MVAHLAEDVLDIALFGRSISSSVRHLCFRILDGPLR